MNVSFIYFDNDLDIAPGPNESFTYNPGDKFIMHWNNSLPTPENYPYPQLLLRMYNVSYIREIDFANHLPILHHDTSIDKGPIPEDRPTSYDPVATSPTEPWPPNDFNCDIQEDNQPDNQYLHSSPPPPKLNEMCICEDAPDPTCPVHRNHPTF